MVHYDHLISSQFHFGQKEVEFAGFSITEQSIKPSKSILEAILNFPKPAKITDARSWFGLVNQVSYNISSSDMMQPFRDLLKPGHWYWDETLDTVFEKSKQAIANIVQQGVRSFEPNRPTCLATDWSKKGLGFTLLQKHCRCAMEDAPNCCRGGWHLVFAGSRFTTDAESRYAPVEGEALAVAYGLEKCRMFTLGCEDLLVATDHKPLVKILRDSSLDNIKNPRLFNLKEKTLLYRYKIKHVPGSWHHAPDACSRNPSMCTHYTTELDISATMDISNSTESHLQAAIPGSSTDNPYQLKALTLERIKEAARTDKECISLTHLVCEGFPKDITSLDVKLRPYWKLRNELYNIDGVTMYDGRIIIPPSLRKEVLECLHSAHQGTVGMKARARSSVYWPGISNAITNRRAQCKTCNTIAPSQPHEPLQLSPEPAYPFELTVADYFMLKGVTYLVYADLYSGWVTIARCREHEANAKNLKRELRTLFCMYGAPTELATDGGQPFPSHDIQQFLCNWGVKWRQSSAYYTQSNGRAELAVKTAKRILQNNTSTTGDLNTDNVARALLQYRNTPIQQLNVSPAELLYGRTLRDHLTSMPDALCIRPEWHRLAEDRERALAKRHLTNIERYNEHTKALPELSIGDTVTMQNQTGSYPNRWDKTGIIVEVRDHGQYLVRLHGSGRCTLRNRRFIRQCTPFCNDSRYTEWPITNIPTEKADEFVNSHPVPLVSNHNDSKYEKEEDNTSPIEQIETETLPDTPTPGVPQDRNELNDTQSELALPPTSTPSSPVLTSLRRSNRTRKAPLELSLRFRGKHHEYCRPSQSKGLPG